MTTPPATDLPFAKLDVTFGQTLAGKFALLRREAGIRGPILIGLLIIAPVTLFGLPDSLATALALGFLISGLAAGDDTFWGWV
ncbi:hypothetical protein [Agrobacterium cavarae]|uniref:hypothetical protein n=1 Tax=Agrobacterium cavarae TaxID=2528239 RepID=UPI0028A276D3|nr:hypothetical protein [Agrobacterium cavarae]